MLTWNGAQLVGLAVCHVGVGTEAGGGKCYIKFGASGRPEAPREFRRLLHSCREFALSARRKNSYAGMNLARLDAYREMLQAGFRTVMQGVAMQRDGDPGYNRSDVFVIDDWR